MIKNLISIIMPVHNEEKYLHDAIESVLKQSYKNFELIIVNDGSTDNTEKIINCFEDHRIKYISPGKVGKNKAFNIAYTNSNGEWFVFFAGDDLMTKNSLLNRLNKVKNFNGSSELVAGVGALRMISEMKKFNNIRYPKNKEKGTFSGGTFILSKGIAEKVFPIPGALPNEDSWTHLHVENFAQIIHIPEEVLHYRIHSNNSFKQHVDFNEKSILINKRALAYNLFYDKYRKSLDINKAKKIEAIILAEEYRTKGEILKILITKNLNLREKIKKIFYSKSYFYKFKGFINRNF